MFFMLNLELECVSWWRLEYACEICRDFSVFLGFRVLKGNDDHMGFNHDIYFYEECEMS